MVKNTKSTKTKKKATKPIVKEMNKVVIPAPTSSKKTVSKKTTRFNFTPVDVMLTVLVIALAVALIVIRLNN